MESQTKSEYRPALGLVVCACCLLVVGLLSACQKSPASMESVTNSTDASATLARHSYDFSPQETSSIMGNSLHEAHAVAQNVDCERCHYQEQWITHEEALALCIDCHEEQIVVDQVWQNHCLSCHQFANYAEHYADSVHVLKELCEDCHGLDSVIFAAFDPTSEHDITCDNCHNPHETSLIYGGRDLCGSCHEDIDSRGNDTNKVHGSCLVCHTPHTPLPASGELCTKCHYASDDVLMHNVPEHPTDCLACHSAHFSTAEVGEHACQVCHDDTFYGGESKLPLPHKDCANCHYINNFVYLGDQACAKCHEFEQTTLNNEDLPPEHSTCETCHEAHSWYTAFEHNCDRCHDVANVLEHKLTFHQHECGTCHNPHSIQTMAKSGDCAGCHTDRKFPTFAADTNDEHLACENCHDQVAIDSRRFTFTGPANSCQMCHPNPDAAGQLAWKQVPFGHQVCNMCHAAHTFDTAPQSKSCDLCHVDMYHGLPAAEHSECANCHDRGHVASFTGQEGSCDICHSEVVGDLAANPSHPTDCDACHSIHGQLVDTTGCGTCHTDLPGLHSPHADSAAGVESACGDCHAAHNGVVDTAASCGVCHTDLPETCGTVCLDCHSFN